METDGVVGEGVGEVTDGDGWRAGLVDELDWGGHFGSEGGGKPGRESLEVGKKFLDLKVG